MKRFILIDGNAILHRAYHAMPDLTNGADPVNAIYGFFGMLLNILQDQKPEYLAVCFDRSKPTIRQSMYAGYHAHRPPMADTLSVQVAKLDSLLETMKAAIFSLEGYEGDDLIGTIATRVVRDQKDAEVIIVTGDRDMLQLVNHRVKVLMPLVGITKTALYDEAAVEDKYGVKPSQFIDYKALIGDPSDGYPGVTGIGPKTAAGLLRQYGTFENLYQQIPELPEKIGLKLATDAEQAALAKKLAAIITDAPMQFDYDTCAVTNFDLTALRKEFEKLNFKSLLARLDARYPVSEKKKEVVKKKEDDGQLGLL
jgi:DNA polymerase I